MKKINPMKAMVVMIMATAISFTVFNENQNQAVNISTSETCSEWQTINGIYIQMKWCKDEEGEVNYRFRNGYEETIHFWYKFDGKDGRTYTGNTIVNANEETDAANMMKSVPSMWYITKKEHKVSNGTWVSF